MKTYLITGGAGFIGSNFIKYILSEEPDIKLINLDKLTYCGNLENLKEIENDPRYTFIKGDIADKDIVEKTFGLKPDILVNFAAESHVDRSISDPDAFIRTDMIGTYVLLEASKKHGLELFIQCSTDEVYGSISEGSSTEEYPLMPSNPYSASKAGADRLCFAYWNTYKVPIIIGRASNNFGPNQYPEKLIPLFITNVLEGKNLPVYGDGMQIRDWLYVKDHCEALYFLIKNGIQGEVYNIGGGNLLPNIELTKQILKHLKKPESLINYVKDRPGHDIRYSLDGTKLKELGWSPKTNFKNVLCDTINWYTKNEAWWKKLKSGEFLEYYSKQYK